MPGQDNEAGGLLCRREISNGDHPLCLGNGSIWNQYFKDAEIVEQIDRDLHRTHQDIKFFSGDSSFSRKNLVVAFNFINLEHYLFLMDHMLIVCYNDRKL